MLNYYKSVHNFNCLEPYNCKTARFIQAVAILHLCNPVPSTYFFPPRPRDVFLTRLQIFGVE